MSIFVSLPGDTGEQNILLLLSPSDLNFETNRILVHRARALQDHCYALIKAEMDSDFEDECRNIVERREKLTKQLEDPEEPKEQPETLRNEDHVFLAKQDVQCWKLVVDLV